MTRNGIALMRHGSVMADSDLIDFLSGPTDSAINFNGSADLHTPIHPPHTRSLTNHFSNESFMRNNLQGMGAPVQRNGMSGFHTNR